MKNAVCRFFTVTLIACGLAGCAGVLSELPDSDDTLTYQDAAEDFSKARDYALNTYVFYDKAAGNQSFLARRVGAVAIPAAGTMIGLATADAVSTETIALAGIGGSTAFATGRYLVN